MVKITPLLSYKKNKIFNYALPSPVGVPKAVGHGRRLCPAPAGFICHLPWVSRESQLLRNGDVMTFPMLSDVTEFLVFPRIIFARVCFDYQQSK